MKRSLKLGWTLFLITGLTGLLLGMVHGITSGPIEATRAELVRNALQTVLPLAEDFLAQPAPVGAPAALVELHRGESPEGPSGYCATVETKGYGGPIRFVVGIDTGGTVTGITLLSSNETPGLGAKASGEAFRDQYVGQAPRGFSVTKKQASGEGEIEALSGATITSRAITNGVNAALETFRKIPKEGNQ